MTVDEVIQELKKFESSHNREGMKRFGINVEKAFGISVTKLRSIAKKIGKDHQLAIQLWNSEIHEARILASMVDDPNLVTKSQMNNWVKDFNSWDLCDQVCSNLFCKTSYAEDKIFEWSKSKKEFIRRAAFSLIACLAVRDKKRRDEEFSIFFDLIKKYSTDERNFVKKSVNWSLRQIGKRSLFLNTKSINLAKEILMLNSNSAKWIAKDAIRELTNPNTIKRIKN
ncbi:MAG: DNA alkylation repair protein [Ignavibacteriales bacterium]|nr:DNA alkylation repair protein [Ignavibacteriales bacterium]